MTDIQERDKEEQRKLAAMGWHCITVWECELKPSKREETLESIAFTLNHDYTNYANWANGRGKRELPESCRGRNMKHIEVVAAVKCDKKCENIAKKSLLVNFVL